MEKEQFEKLASDIYDKWVLNYEGRIYMTKDLFTLSLYEFWNTHVVPLQEKIAGFDSLLDTLNDQAKREFKKLESENKALREEIDRISLVLLMNPPEN